MGPMVKKKAAKLVRLPSGIAHRGRELAAELRELAAGDPALELLAALVDDAFAARQNGTRFTASAIAATMLERMPATTTILEGTGAAAHSARKRARTTKSDDDEQLAHMLFAVHYVAKAFIFGTSALDGEGSVDVARAEAARATLERFAELAKPYLRADRTAKPEGGPDRVHPHYPPIDRAHLRRDLERAVTNIRDVARAASACAALLEEHHRLLPAPSKTFDVPLEARVRVELERQLQRVNPSERQPENLVRAALRAYGLTAQQAKDLARS